MDRIDIFIRHQSFPDPLLVTDHDDPAEQRRKNAECIRYTWQKFKLRPRTYVIILNTFIDHPVAVEE
jgi:hypothetical protein